MSTPPPDFSKFVNMLYSKGLKLSVRVSSFSEEILICQLCVYHFDVAIGIILVVIGHFTTVFAPKLIRSFFNLRQNAVLISKTDCYAGSSSQLTKKISVVTLNMIHDLISGTNSKVRVFLACT